MSSGNYGEYGYGESGYGEYGSGDYEYGSSCSEAYTTVCFTCVSFFVNNRTPNFRIATTIQRSAVMLVMIQGVVGTATIASNRSLLWHIFFNFCTTDIDFKVNYLSKRSLPFTGEWFVANFWLHLCHLRWATMTVATECVDQIATMKPRTGEKSSWNRTHPTECNLHRSTLANQHATHLTSFKLLHVGSFHFA